MSTKTFFQLNLCGHQGFSSFWQTPKSEIPGSEGHAHFYYAKVSPRKFAPEFPYLPATGFLFKAGEQFLQSLLGTF